MKFWLRMKSLIISLCLRSKSIFFIDIEVWLIIFWSYLYLSIAQSGLDASVIKIIWNSCIILRVHLLIEVNHRPILIEFELWMHNFMSIYATLRIWASFTQILYLSISTSSCCCCTAFDIDIKSYSTDSNDSWGYDRIHNYHMILLLRCVWWRLLL